jgi:hypothetical protein
LVHITPDEYNDILAHFEQALAKEPFDRSEFTYEGLADAAPDVLVEQGRRGGPMLSLIRLLQSQLKCIRILLLVGDDKPEKVYHIDLVGAHPYTDYKLGEDLFYEDIVLRTATYESTYEVTKHEVVGDLIPEDVWDELPTVAAMTRAGQEMGKRKFFTDMLRIVDLVPVPGLNDAIADQYSEGCFATWDPNLDALLATVTGSARPVDKGNITDDELAVIVGVRPDGQGALVRHVEGTRNDSPSSESVEMMEMDRSLPTVTLGPAWDTPAEVPVVRSKLHGHRGIASYDPRHVEHVDLDPPFYHYLVSCATEAQAQAIKSAFARSEALQDPDDPRQVAFTVLPGHGVVIVEKWVPGKAPFQVLWEYMDAGYLVVENRIPQGSMQFVPEGTERMVLHTP